jgi:hypothetical protein
MDAGLRRHDGSFVARFANIEQPEFAAAVRKLETQNS